VGKVRRAFRMAVHTGQEAEYARRHQQIWREMEQTLIAHGVRTYSIYIDPVTSDLFAYVEFDNEERWQAVAATDVCRRWWRHMCDIMPSNADSSPVTTELREVFHLEST